MVFEITKIKFIPLVCMVCKEVTNENKITNKSWVDSLNWVLLKRYKKDRGKEIVNACPIKNLAASEMSTLWSEQMRPVFIVYHRNTFIP